MIQPLKNPLPTSAKYIKKALIASSIATISLLGCAKCQNSQAERNRKNQEIQYQMDHFEPETKTDESDTDKNIFQKTSEYIKNCAEKMGNNIRPIEVALTLQLLGLAGIVINSKDEEDDLI